MKRKTKVQYLNDMFLFWMGKLRLEKPLDIIKDDRLDCVACVDNWQNPNKICLKYNANKLRKCCQGDLLDIVFHELRHVKNPLPYESEEEQIKCEYDAEKYAIQMLKKHYPKQLAFMLNKMKKNKAMEQYKKTDPLYYKAYIKIPEYKALLEGDSNEKS